MLSFTPYELARFAECTSPDSNESPGARFLESIQDDVNDRLTDGAPIGNDEWIMDAVSEVADNAPDIYTHAMWLEFIDLCAYREDPSDLGADGSNMESAARLCLYIIAERLASALFEEARDSDDEEDDEGGQEGALV